MYTSFRIKNYRCFEDLTVKPLATINLVTGRNNVGKTALLEALWLHHGYYNPELGLRVTGFRGMARVATDEFYWDLFRTFDPSQVIEFTSLDQHNQEWLLRITSQRRATSQLSLNRDIEKGQNGRSSSVSDGIDQESTGSVNAEIVQEFILPTGEVRTSSAYVTADTVHFNRAHAQPESLGVFLTARQRGNSGELAERLTNLAVSKKEEKILRILQIVEPRLERLSVQVRGGDPLVYGDIGLNRLIPVPLMGEGLGRLLQVAVAVPEAENGILLIDEIENGLHYSVITNVWKAIARLCEEYNVQVVATTHSDECIRSAREAFTACEAETFALHRLEWTDRGPQSFTFDLAMLEAAEDVDAEVR